MGVSVYNISYRYVCFSFYITVGLSITGDGAYNGSSDVRVAVAICNVGSYVHTYLAIDYYTINGYS